MQTFLTWDFFFMLLFFREKNSKPVRYTRTLYSQTGKNTKWAETFVWCLLLLFKVVYWDHLTQLPVTSLCKGFCGERAAAGLGPKWVKSWLRQQLFLPSLRLRCALKTRLFPNLVQTLYACTPALTPIIICTVSVYTLCTSVSHIDLEE